MLQDLEGECNSFSRSAGHVAARASSSRGRFAHHRQSGYTASIEA